MREIKFRAWDSDHNEMLPGQSLQLLMTKDPLTTCQVDNLEYMQFTGLKGKGGVEIYEGDIVIYDDYSNGAFVTRKQPQRKRIIRFDHEHGAYKLPGQGFHPDWSAVEVIGNIHQNPELLEAA